MGSAKLVLFTPSSRAFDPLEEATFENENSEFEAPDFFDDALVLYVVLLVDHSCDVALSVKLLPPYLFYIL